MMKKRKVKRENNKTSEKMERKRSEMKLLFSMIHTTEQIVSLYVVHDFMKNNK